MTFTTDGTDEHESLSKFKMICELKGLDMGDAIDKFKLVADAYGWDFDDGCPLTLDDVVCMGNTFFERLNSLDDGVNRTPR